MATAFQNFQRRALSLAGPAAILTGPIVLPVSVAVGVEGPFDAAVIAVLIPVVFTLTLIFLVALLGGATDRDDENPD